MLAAVGTYSVISYLVRQGTRDLGLRLALGATPAAILGFVVRQGLGLAGAGVAMGVAGALLLGRVLEGLLFGITPSDPATLAATSAGLVVVAAAAAGCGQTVAISTLSSPCAPTTVRAASIDD